MSGPKIFSARSTSAEVMGQFASKFVGGAPLKSLTEGVQCDLEVAGMFSLRYLPIGEEILFIGLL